MRRCLLEPVPEIAVAADYLSDAVTAHLAGNFATADELIRRADLPAIRDWTESLWGKDTAWLRNSIDPALPLSLPIERRTGRRMPSASDRHALVERDGYHCRFCGIPVVRKGVRDRIRLAYPEALRWGRKNGEQHAAFQAMWLQYDHILPHARGGLTELGNMVITCAPCNFGRWQHTLEEVALLDPRLREPISSSWDGLERFR